MKRWASLVLLLTAMVVLTSCGGNPAASGNTKSSQPSSAKTLRLHANGTPNLTGLQISMGNSAGSTHLGDTNVYDMLQYLHKWGATVSPINNLHGTGAELGVLSGGLSYCTSQYSTEVDAGLTVFGPSMAHVDYVLLVNPAIHSIRQLKGKPFAISNSVSPDAILLSAALRKVGLKPSDLQVTYTGGDDEDLNELIAGKVDGAFVPSASLLTTGTRFKVLATGRSVAPSFADSFVASSPSWLRSHPATAEAVDLAWLAAAKEFDTQPQQWVKAAEIYTGNANSVSYVEATYKSLKTINAWPISSAAIFSQAVVKANQQFSRTQGDIQGLGNRPMAQLATMTPWNAAFSLFQAHESAY